jgi:hypothetical protein
MGQLTEWLSNFRLWLARYSFNSGREDFYKELAEAVNAGESVSVFLAAQVAEAVKYREANAAMLYRRMLRRQDEKQGRFSHMLATIVPQGDIFALTAVDEVDVKAKKVESLLFLADSVVRVRKMAGMVLGALQTLFTMLPVFVVFAVINAVMVVPEYEAMVPVDQWPAIGKSLYWVSFSIRNFWYVQFVFIVGVIWLFLHSLDNWRGPTRSKFDKRFPYSLYRDFHGNILLVRLAQLLQSDLGLSEALQMLRAKATPWMQWHLHRILRNMDGDFNLDYASIFDTGVFSRRLQKRVGAQARRGEFKHALVEIGSVGMENVMDDMRRASNKMNRISLILCMLGILYFHVAVQITANDVISKMRQETDMIR